MQTQPESSAVARPQEASFSISSKWRWVLYATAAVALVLALKYFHVQDLLKSALDWIGQLGPWGPVIFVGLYVVATVLFVPGSVLTLGAGAVFGVALGSVCVSISATLGATAAFLVGRYLARDTIARKIQRNEKFATIDRAVADEGWKIVLLTRLSPVSRSGIPFCCTLPRGMECELKIHCRRRNSPVTAMSWLEWIIPTVPWRRSFRMVGLS